MNREEIIELAIAVFGNPDAANRWLNKPKQRLGDATPLDVLETMQGREMVAEWLHAIDEGVFW